MTAGGRDAQVNGIRPFLVSGPRCGAVRGGSSRTRGGSREISPEFARLAGMLASSLLLVALARVGEFVPAALARPFLVAHAGIHEIVGGRSAASHALENRTIVAPATPAPPPAAEAPPGWLLYRSRGVLPEPFSRRLVVERLGSGSSAESARPGAAVVTTFEGDLAYVGQVARSTSEAATVIGVNDPSSSVPVRLDGYGSGLLLRGSFPGLAMELLYLPSGIELKRGAEVRLSGEHASGALVGWIEEFGPGEGPFQRVSVRPAVRLEEVGDVRIEDRVD